MKCELKKELSLTCTKDWGGDLYFTCCLIRLKGWDIVGAKLTAKYLWTLGACGAGTGAITSVMWVLFIKHCYQLETKGKFAIINKAFKITTLNSIPHLTYIKRETVLVFMHPGCYVLDSKTSRNGLSLYIALLFHFLF